jgi:hypothetical protein
VRKHARKELYAFAKKRKMADKDDDEKSAASLNNIKSKEDGKIDLLDWPLTSRTWTISRLTPRMTATCLAAMSPSEDMAWMSNYAT